MGKTVDPDLYFEEEAYHKGKARRKENTTNPQNKGGPKDDGYGNMTPEEKAAYKKGFRGD